MIQLKFTMTSKEMRDFYRSLRKEEGLTREAAHWAIAGFMVPDWALTAISYGALLRTMQDVDGLFEDKEKADVH